jgi:uncharacterized membrane-anchored protein
MTLLPPDHPLRLPLADEVHARPSEPVHTPCRAGYIAVLVAEEARAAELAHLVRLCVDHGVAPPAAGDTHWRGRFGELVLKWERHGEFSGYLFIEPGLAASAGAAGPAGDDAAPWARLRSGWLERLPGQTIVAARALVMPATDGPPEMALLEQHFGGHAIVGAAIGDGAGWAYTDFRVRGDGCVRFVLANRSLKPPQAGRMLQRLFEIEAYRMLALLALPIARRQAPRIAAIERALAELTDGIAREDGREEALLGELTRLAAEVESGLAASRFRFGACRAYADLVRQRIAELRELRIEGLQTVEEFMARRFAPAMATCLNVEHRLHDLAERVAQASSLLATRVGIARERQNQELLASMDRRARQQLRLQQTVEGLSVAAIVYYVVGLVAYVAKGLKAGGVPLAPDLTTLLAIPVAAGVVIWALRRARRRLQDAEAAPAAKSP